MIKIGKMLYIHYSTVLFFIICWFTRHFELLLLSYFTVLLHETAHFITATLIGIEPSYIVFFPFGVNLRVKSKIIYSISDEILLYMSGPLINAVLALIIQLIGVKSAVFTYFYWNNIGLFIFNLLPILPMDGGMVIKRILSDRIGNKRSGIILKTVSVIMIAVLIIFEIQFLLNKKVNFPMIFVLAFLIANIFTNTEKYSMDLVKELIYIKEKQNRDCVKAEVFLVNEKYSERKIAEQFNPSKSYLVLKKNRKGKITGILTEEEIIDRILFSG